MQESRRWRGLQLNLLSLVAACSAAPAPVPTAPAPSAMTPAAVTQAPVAPAPAPATIESAGAAAPPRGDAPAPAIAPLAELPAGTKVLQVGDSFAAALGIELGKRLKAAGVRTSLEYKTASYVPTWAFGPELPKLIS